MRRLLQTLLVCATCLPAACIGQLPTPLQPPATQRPILVVQGRGSQIYGCRMVGGAFQWVFQAPVARLFDTQGSEVGTHGDGPVWNYQDSSSISGVLVAAAPSPDPANIPWLLLKGMKPQRVGILATAQFITRSETKGGIGPANGCDAAHEGSLTRVPYTATYTFYTSVPATD